jgi:DNA-binding NtrC family response regulator
MGYDARHARPKGESGSGHRSILFIDDDVELLDMLKTYLEREEFEVVTANTR